MNRHLQRGQHLHDLGRFSEAMVEFGRSMMQDDEQHRPAAQALLAAAQLDQGEVTKARTNLHFARALAPEDPTVRAIAIGFAVHDHDFALARREAADLLAQAPRDPARLGLCAHLEFLAGEPDTALAFARRGLAADPADTDCLGVAASACLEREDHAAAGEYAARLLALAPESFDVHLLRVRHALAVDDSRAARLHSAEARRLSPTNPAGHVALALCDARAHWGFRLLSGWVGSWRMPAWLRVACFVSPMVLDIGLGFLLGREPAGELGSRLSNPFFLLGVWLVARFGWERFYLLVRATREALLRKAFRADAARHLATLLPVAVFALILACHLVFGVAVSGVMFSGVFLWTGFFMLASKYGERVLRPGVVAPFVLLFGGALSLQIALWVGASWAAPALLALVIALFAALLLIGIAVGRELSPSPPPLPFRPSHEPPPLPR